VGGVESERLSAKLDHSLIDSRLELKQPQEKEGVRQSIGGANGNACGESELRAAGQLLNGKGEKKVRC